MRITRVRGLPVLVIILISLLITSCAQGPGTQVFTTPGKPPAKTRVTSEDLMLVDQLMLNRKFQEAVSKIQELQQIEPSNPSLQEKLRQAAGEWKFAEAQNLMAVGAYGEAINKIKSALDLIPNDERMLLALDEAYLQLGMQYLSYLDAEKAREALSSVSYDQNMKLQAQGLLTAYVPAVEYTQQGYEALTNGNYSMALGYFKAALQLKPDLQQALNGQKAAEAMASAQPPPSTGYSPTPGPYPSPGTPIPTEVSPTPSSEVSTWEKPEVPSGVQDWSNFKGWMEQEINRWMSGSSINENPLLGYENLSLNEDPQAYNYLSESDFASTLYLSAIKIYGERALYIASEIPRLFPLPLLSDPSYQVTQKRIGRLNRAVDFIFDGVNGLKAPTIFKETHNKLLDLINEEKRVLNSLWYGSAFPPSGVGDLSGMSQAYVDAFDKAQAKTLSLPFSELPKWAQLKKYYIETGLYAYMLNEVARDFEDMLPLPTISEPSSESISGSKIFGPVLVTLTASSNYNPGDNFVSYILETTLKNTSQSEIWGTINLKIPKVLEILQTGEFSVSSSGDFWVLSSVVNLNDLSTKPLSPISLKTPSGYFGENLKIEGNFEVQTPFLQVPAFPPYISDWIRLTPSMPAPGDLVEIRCGIVRSTTAAVYLKIQIPEYSEMEFSTLGSSLEEIGGVKYAVWQTTLSPSIAQDFLIRVRLANDSEGKQLVSSALVEAAPIYKYSSGEYGVGETIGPIVTTITSREQRVSLELDTPQAPDPTSMVVFDETVRLVRYAEQLHYNLAKTMTPSNVDQVAHQGLLKAATELSSVLYWIPVKWASLSTLGNSYLAQYPYYSGDVAGLFNPSTKLADKFFDLQKGYDTWYFNPDQPPEGFKGLAQDFLTFSTDLTFSFGDQNTWKDMIEYLRAQLLQRLAELGYR